MKRLLFIALIALFVVPFTVLAEDVTINDGNPVLVDWTFEPEVTTDFGFNLDWGHIGIDSSAKISISSTIRDEANQEFGEGSGNYGSITVEDLKIEFAPDDLTPSDDSKKSTAPLTASIGDIIGTIHFGSVYLTLDDTGGDLGKVGGLDADYAVISTDLIGVYETGVTVDLNGGISSSTNGVEDSALVQRKAGAKLGFKTDGVDINLQIAQKYSYNEVNSALDENNELLSNETVFGLSADLTFGAFGFGLGGYMVAGGNQADGVENIYDGRAEPANSEFWSTFLTPGNPATAWVGISYSLPVAGYTLKPIVGFDLGYEKIVGPKGPQGTDGKFPTAEFDAVEFEVAAAVKLLWDDRDGALSGDEDGHIDLTAGDEEVSDGVSLGVAYGTAISDVGLSTSYLGAKIAAFHSAGTIIPDLKLGAILNFNYNLGINKSDDFIVLTPNDGGTPEDTADDTIGLNKDFEGGAGMNVGTGFEAYYALTDIYELGLGVSYLAYLSEDKVTYINGAGEKVSQDLVRPEDNDQHDLRLFVGLEAANIVPNATISLKYRTGDLLNDASIEQSQTYYGSTSATGAVAGDLVLGFKVSF